MIESSKSSESSRLRRSDLEKLAATIEELPTLPEVAISIFNLIEDPKSSARDIQRVMSEDPALAGKVLRLVNSAYFGFAHKISDLGHAIVILGFATIRSIAMGISIIETFKDNPGRKATGFDVEKFWMHAVGMGHVCKAIAKELKRGNPDVAFVVGLLHDIGKLVIDQYRPQEMLEILDEAQVGDATFYAAETALGRYTHADLGGLLTKNWRLAEEVAEAVRSHHNLEAAAHNPYVGVIQLGNYICSLEGLDAGGDCGPHTLEGPTRAALGLDDAKLAALRNKLGDQKEAIRTFLQMAR